MHPYNKLFYTSKEHTNKENYYKGSEICFVVFEDFGTSREER